MNPDILAFDFDGVLANSLSIALEEYRRIILSEFTMIPVPEGADCLVHIFPGPLRTSLRRFGLNDAQRRRFFDLHSAAMRLRVDEINLFSEAVEIVRSLDVDRFAIITSAYGDAVRAVFERCAPGVLRSEAQILGRELSLSKSQKLLKVAGDKTVDVKNIVKIGDMVSDILYAREVGIRAWVVGWGYHPISYLAAFGPDRCFETFSQLSEQTTGRIT